MTIYDEGEGVQNVLKFDDVIYMDEPFAKVYPAEDRLDP
jgi:hypothetical protein